MSNQEIPILIPRNMHENFHSVQKDSAARRLSELEEDLNKIKKKFKGSENSPNYKEQVQSLEADITQLKKNLEIFERDFKIASQGIEKEIKNSGGRPVQYIGERGSHRVIYNYKIENGKITFNISDL